MILLITYMLLYRFAKKDVTITKTTTKYNEKQHGLISVKTSLSDSEVTQSLRDWHLEKQNKKAEANKQTKAKQNSLDQNKQDTCAMLSRK